MTISVQLRSKLVKDSFSLQPFSDAGLPNGENTNQNHFENQYQAQIAAYQQYYQQNPHLYGHHHSHQPLNPGQPGYQNPYQPYAAAHFSNQLYYQQQQQIYAHYQQQQIQANHQQQQQHQQLSPNGKLATNLSKNLKNVKWYFVKGKDIG